MPGNRQAKFAPNRFEMSVRGRCGSAKLVIKVRLPLEHQAQDQKHGSCLVVVVFEDPWKRLRSG